MLPDEIQTTQTNGPAPAPIVNAETSTVEQRASAAFRSLLNCSLVTENYCRAFGNQSLVALEDELVARTEQMMNGDLRLIEGMLFAQAQALQSIFVELALQATESDRYQTRLTEKLSLAPKAQAGSRATLQALIDLKRPRSPTFVGQQNVAYQQQVNNGQPTGMAGPRTAFKNGSNELLSEVADEGMDEKRAGGPIGPDSDLETMGKVDGRKDCARQIAK